MVVAIAVILMDFQSHSRKRVHRELGAHQHRHPASRVDTSLSRCERDDTEPGEPHRFRGARVADYRANTRTAWLSARLSRQKLIALVLPRTTYAGTK